MLHYNGFSPGERDAVGQLLRSAIRSGALQRPTQCCVCGAMKKLLARRFGSSTIWKTIESRWKFCRVALHATRNCTGGSQTLAAGRPR